MRLLLLLVALVLAPMATAQTVDMDWYMSSQSSATHAGAELLTQTAPTGAVQTHQFSPLLAGTGPTPANTYLWASDAPFDQDYEILGDTEVTLFFNLGVDVQATTTVVLSSVAADGTLTEIGRDSDTGLLEVAAHSETFALPTDAIVLAQGTTILLSVSVTGTALAIQMEYGGAASAAGITGFTLQPTADMTTGPGGQPTNGAAETNDDASPEIWVATLLFTISLAAAGIARLGRFPA